MPRGQVGIEDVYDKEGITDVVIRFHPDDFDKSCIPGIEKIFTAQAQRWAERTSEPAVEWHPVTFRVLRRTDLPDGAKILLNDTEDEVYYIFAADVITAPAAAAFEHAIAPRAATWVRLSIAS
jgi:hypothetical protein